MPYYDVPYSEARRVVGAALHRRWFRHPRFWSAINACAAPLLIVALVSTEDEVLSGPYAAWDNWIVWGGIFLAVMLLINAARLFGYKSDLFRYGFSVFLRFLFWLIVPGLAMVAGFLAVHAPLFYFVYPKLEQWGAMTWIHEQFSHKADVFISCFILVAAARNQFVRPTIDRLFYGMAAALETWLAALRLPSAKSAERRDRRAPILYLRSFLDDQNALDAGSGDAVRLEEVVAHPLQDCGPLVAIGTPGEFTTPGAARAYFKDDEWQGAVISMMLRSAYIVIVSGWTKGLQWEVQTIKTQGHLGKSIWILPPPGKHHDVICDWLRAGFRATPYERTARRADLRKALVVHPRSDGELVVITGRWASRGEYEAAIIAAMYGMVRHLADERKR